MDTWGFKELGVTAIIFIPFMFLLRWVLAEVSNILKRECEERTKWQEIITTFGICQTQLMEEHREFREQVGEAHRFQREEHKEQLNEHREQLNEQKEQTAQLRGITLVLGRINGYTHEN